MTARIVLLFILSISITSFSQVVEKGSIIKDRQFLIDKNELTASDSNGNFISIRPHRINGTLRNYFVEFFDELDFENRIEIETEGDTDILKVFILNEAAHVFIKEKVDKRISLKLNSLDLNSKEQSQTILYEIEKATNPSVYKALKDNYNINLEEASDLILSFPVVEDKKTSAHIKVFSKNLALKSDVILSPDDAVSHKHVNYLNTKQSNNKIYSLFQLNNTLEDNYYKLIEINGSEQRSLNIEIPDHGHELINSKISGDHMIISGLYSNSKKGGYLGFSYYNIHLDTFNVTSTQNTFLNEKASRYFKGLFKNNRSIDIKDIFINDKLETYIIGQFYIVRKKVAPISIPIATFSFAGAVGFITINPISARYKVYDDMIIGKIDASGELLWDNILELRQTEKIKSKSNKRDSSTFTFFANNEINILINGFINEDKEQLVVKQDKRLNKTNLYNIIVNPYGGVTPKIVLSNSDSETLFRTEKSVISDNIIFILGQGNMRKQLLKLQF